MKIHSYLSPKCIKKSSKIHNSGIFAKSNVKKGELLSIWGGYIITLPELKKLPKSILDYSYPVQIFEDIYLGPIKKKDLDDGEMFNHSCDPNAGVRGQIVLVARKNIKKGEEIFFDYETTDTQNLKFICHCGAKKCRGKIDGSSWKNPEFQKANKNYFSLYLEEKIRKLNRKK